jgi:hypothetical protein
MSAARLEVECWHAMPVPAEPDNLLPRSKYFRHDIKLALSPGRIVFALISCAILIPCFWHRHIQAGDSGSHVYNAWLADLVGKNQAPGVYVVWRWDNILFDLLLSGFGKFVGWDLAEKLAVSLCVLIFFWGVFFLITTLAGRQPWALAPGLAMLAYGYTFHVGFFNYYLSIGLACVGLALIRRGGKSNFLIAIALSPLILLSHRLGFLWFLATAAYLFLWRNLQRWKPLLPVLVILGAIATRIAVHFLAARGFWSDVGWPERPFYILNGTDQFAVFGPSFWYVSWFCTAWAIFFVLLDWRQARWSAKWLSERRLALELFLVAFCWTSLLPENLLSSNGTGWIGLIVSRLTLITAIFALCLLGSVRIPIPGVLALAVCAAVFFTMIYQNTASLERMETNANQLITPLPFGSRVLRTVQSDDDWRAEFIYHLLDRACIGHCFAYSNYEAATKQFRVRVNPGSSIVTADPDESESMESGEYRVQEEDLPIWQIDQCDPEDWTQLCIRKLKAGETNGGNKK